MNKAINLFPELELFLTTCSDRIFISLVNYINHSAYVRK